MKLPRRLLSGLLAAALVPLGAVTLAPASPAAADPAPAPAGAEGNLSRVYIEGGTNVGYL